MGVLGSVEHPTVNYFGAPYPHPAPDRPYRNIRSENRVYPAVNVFRRNNEHSPLTPIGTSPCQ